MPVQKTRSPVTGPPGALARPDWKPGGEFTAADLRLDQGYKEQRSRRHLRLVHGWGVACGLTVVSAGEDWWLYLCPGFGISPCGDELLVPAPYRFNLRDYLWTRPLGPHTGDIAWVAIEAAEYVEDFRVAPTHACGCASNNQEPQAAYVAAGFRVVVSWTRPVLRHGQFDICGGGAPECPPCPGICALPLAGVSLPSFNDWIPNPAIRNLSIGGL